jgi:transcription antitermination factor NusG
MALCWYVALTHPGGSRTAEDILKRQSFDVFNPKVRIRRVSPRRGLWFSERHYFPGYVFVRFDTEFDDWEVISYTRGIRKLISAHPLLPIPVRGEAIDFLRQRCDDEGFVFEAESLDREWLAVGRKVRVIDGLLTGTTGHVLWTHGERVKVLLAFMGSSRSVEIRAAMLESAA